ncbi:hypothetical protein [Staphylococcus edaphicus]|uniref:Uncharacterized protein n=1 Tax=Staphylococcus edaphicus TaxID=1955013 RepID=A0A2C6VE15_9STAP|nr:hypothetical protein [Staphylococcus edaphicus]PHK48571.1 hypothetical protein BTJ66_12950 [Staphylococcus edaphicus]UQW81450.1 hypothetical protein MNY58_12975 [Staphylococcus edaphicus]
MKKVNSFGTGFYIASFLNIFLLIGLVFIVQSENLIITMIWTLLSFVNAVYLLVNVLNNNRKQ